MRIVHITWSFRFGGIETMLVNIINEQLILNHDIHLIIMEDLATEATLLNSIDKRIKIHYGHRKKGGNLLLPVIYLNLILLKINPNVIHVHSSSMCKIILIPWLKKVVNSTLHDTPGEKNTMAIEQVARVFTISESVASDLRRIKNVDSVVNPNGIHPERIKQRYPHTPEVVKLVQVSRLMHEKKGQHILIKAAALLRQRGYDNFTLSFIGNGESSDYLHKLTAELGLKDQVEFLGNRNQSYIFEHLCDYDLFIQPSIYEGFGLTVVEAMAAKVPVMVSSGQGPQEVIKDGQYGCIFKNGDIKDCADKIEIFLKHENKLQQIEAAYQHVLDMYNIKVTVRRYLENYLKR